MDHKSSLEILEEDIKCILKSPIVYSENIYSFEIMLDLFLKSYLKIKGYSEDCRRMILKNSREKIHKKYSFKYPSGGVLKYYLYCSMPKKYLTPYWDDIKWEMLQEIFNIYDEFVTEVFLADYVPIESIFKNLNQ
jgi:hypothetical protein